MSARKATLRGVEIMRIVRESSGSGATQWEIAQLARTSPGHISQAARVLHNAPDLASLVERAEIGITDAYRILFARTLSSTRYPL
jgi:hypothetical protein